MEEGYLITDKNTKISIPAKRKHLKFFHENILELKCNNEAKSLLIFSNKLTTLILNDKITYVCCYSKILKCININKNLQELKCNINTILYNVNKYIKITLNA